MRDLSKKFDNWSPKDFHLSPQEIERAIAQVPKRDLDDIKFAQAQVRNFAQKQRDTMHDLEVETLPGVVLGHRHIPVNSIGCYVPGGRYPMVAIGAYVDRHRQGRGREAHHRLRATVQGRAASGHRRSNAFRRRRRHLRTRRRAGRGGHGARHRNHQAGRHDRRPRQCLRGGSQAPTVRPRRHRSAGRADRDADHRRRQRRRRNLRHRPARPGRARAHLPRRPDHQFREARARHHEGGRAAADDPAHRRRSPARPGRTTAR